MVGSMRHWAKAAGIIAEPKLNTVCTTPLGDLLFGEHGLDPYMEHPATLWLVHWHLAARPAKTTWFWAFSHYPALTFERDKLIRGLERLAEDRTWPRVAHSTVSKDVACFIRTYVPQQISGKGAHDDALESPLTELGLIKAVGKKDGFRFVRGAKPTLGHGVFVYALLDFWSQYSSASTLSFESITYAPGSPGRVFAFDENDVADRLAALDDVSRGSLRWSETAGLKQVVRTIETDEPTRLSYVPLDCGAPARKEAG